MVQRGYLPGLPVLVRVDQVNERGEVDKTLWDATVTLSVDEPVTLSSTQVTLRNGRGSALITISGVSDFNLTATLGPLSVSRSIRPLNSDPVVQVSGTLPGAATTWSGIIQVTGDVTVPAGHTLTIHSNTLVMVNGVASGTVAPDILVAGNIQSLGTEEHPITITSTNAGLYWGQIRHNNAQPSLYQYTSINRAGRAPGEGHTGRGPAIRPTGSRIRFDHCNLTDYAAPNGSPGKTMQGSGSDLTLTDCLLSRAGMGPELAGTALLCSNTYFLEFRNGDDADALYVHTQAAGQRVLLTDCVIGYTDDDGLDTLGADVTLERCIIRNMNSGVDPDAKGISAFNGVTHLKRCLIVDCIISMATKWNGGPASLVTINECTILGGATAVYANWKENAPGPFIDYRITNSILRAADAVKTDFGDTNFTIHACNISEAWPGTGNQIGDPLFIGGYDFRLQTGSPCIDAGMSFLDPDGSPIDLGAFTFIPAAPILSEPRRAGFVLNGMTNRNFVVESSTALPAWNTVGTFFQTNAANRIVDPSLFLGPFKLYRARLAP